MSIISGILNSNATTSAANTQAQSAQAGIDAQNAALQQQLEAQQSMASQAIDAQNSNLQSSLDAQNSNLQAQIDATNRNSDAALAAQETMLQQQIDAQNRNSDNAISSQNRNVDLSIAAQKENAQKAIDQQNLMFGKVQYNMQPYMDSGVVSEDMQRSLLGMNGNAAQQYAITQIKNSSQFDALNRQGQDALLQNSAATGGLRGGNTQAALAQFSPNLLQSLINDQYAKLSGMTSVGENAAAFTGNAGMSSANSISGTLGNSANAQSSTYGNSANAISAILAGNSNGLSSAYGNSSNLIASILAGNSSGINSAYNANSSGINSAYGLDTSAITGLLGNSANQITNAYGNNANSISSLLAQQGAANAGGIMGNASSFGNAINNGFSAYGAYNRYNSAGGGNGQAVDYSQTPSVNTDISPGASSSGYTLGD